MWLGEDDRNGDCVVKKHRGDREERRGRWTERMERELEEEIRNGTEPKRRGHLKTWATRRTKTKRESRTNWNGEMARTFEVETRRLETDAKEWTCLPVWRDKVCIWVVENGWRRKETWWVCYRKNQSREFSFYIGWDDTPLVWRAFLYVAQRNPLLYFPIKSKRSLRSNINVCG